MCTDNYFSFLLLLFMISDGEPDKPLIVHVGRLGVEKNLDFLKRYCLSLLMRKDKTCTFGYESE